MRYLLLALLLCSSVAMGDSIRLSLDGKVITVQDEMPYTNICVKKSDPKGSLCWRLPLEPTKSVGPFRWYRADIYKNGVKVTAGVEF